MAEREELERLNKEIGFYKDQLVQELEQRARLVKRMKSDADKHRHPVFGPFDSIHINIMKLDKEKIEDVVAPRSGAPWLPFESDHLDQRFTEFIQGKAIRQGRTTKAIRYKLLYFLLRDLPLENLLDKIHNMISDIGKKRL